jgi:Uma2 family endonuclease
MATQTTEKLLTAEEFYRLPDPPHGGRMELWEGKVRTEMPVGRPHGRSASRIDRALGNFVDANELGEVGIEAGHVLRRGPDTVFAPDVHYFSKARVAELAATGFAEGPPTLAVEVTSPGDTKREIADKVQRYLDGGTERVWLADEPTRSVTVHRGDGTVRTLGAEEFLTSDDAGFEIDGFALKVGEIFK